MRANRTCRVAGLGALAVAVCGWTACAGRTPPHGVDEPRGDVASSAGETTVHDSAGSSRGIETARASRGIETARTSRGIELVGCATIAADASDLSGLTGKLTNGMPQNRMGSFGSAIAWTGTGDRYIAVSDRGPSDGMVPYKSRFHELEIRVRPGESPAVKVELTGTTLLVDASGESFIGSASAFDVEHPLQSLRLDPEAVRVARDGHIFLSDEYGPLVLEFDRAGKLLKRLPVPAEFAIEHPSADPKAEIDGNTRGRVANKGLEGLAISADGSRLYALIESPLLQDHGKKGVNCRLLEIDLATQKTRQFVLQSDEPKHNFNELLAIGGRRFLAIERDSESGVKARFKRIVEVDLAGATDPRASDLGASNLRASSLSASDLGASDLGASDVSAIASLPASDLPPGVKAASKKPFLDLLDPKFGLAGARFPEKIEGLAFGPDLPDGRHVLIVTSDNDFLPDWPSWFWVFAIDPRELPGFEPQVFDRAR